MEPQTPQSQPNQQLQPPTPPPNPSYSRPTPPGNHKNLVISLVVAAVLLIAAIAIAVWLMTKEDSGSVVGNSNSASDTKNDELTKDVLKVSFVEPAKVPSNYPKRDQSTSDITTIYYFDNATSCGITLSTLKLGGQYGSTPKEAIVNSAKTAESLGVKTSKSVDGPALRIKDATTDETYTFNSLELEQDVNVEGVTFKKQNNIVAFKQFGEYVASIGYSCKSETWASKKAELASLAASFKIKTEK